MASTYSDLKFELIGTGEQSGTWGVTTNTNLGTAIEEAITGSADVTFASGNVTLTLTDTNASQTARNLRLNCTGTTGGARDLIVPNIEKFYLVNNGCADAITIKNSTGSGVAVPAGKAMLVFNNATDVVEGITYITALQTSTATIGTLSLTNDLAITEGGTGASTADSALTNLGGTTVGKGVFTAASAAAAQQAMDTEVGVDVQAYNAGLTDIAGLAKTDGNVIVGDGTNWVAESGSTARTSLGLGTIATQNSNSVTITGGSVTGITDLAVADGGTGASSFTANNVLLGNGTSSFQEVAPGTSGNVLTSNGTTWTSAAAGGGGAIQTQIFTAPGTWTRPSTVDSVEVVCIGGGAGSPAGNFPAAGNPGGTSSFGSLVTATGGSGGSPNPSGGQSGPNGTGNANAGTVIKGGNSTIASAKTGEYLIMSGGVPPGAANTAYATNQYWPAGFCNVTTPGAGGNTGNGGYIHVTNVPVSNPQTVTVGAGGNWSGPKPIGTTAGAVAVRWIG